MSTAPPFGVIDQLEDIAESARSDAPATLGVALTVCGVSDAGVVRSNNEDALVVVDLAGSNLIDVVAKRASLEAGQRGVLLAVSDGMGGENAGEVASALVLETVRRRLAIHSTSADTAEALAAAVQYANACVNDAAVEPGNAGMGATIVAVLVSGSTAFTAEVGDSRAYVLRRGILAQITKDQTHAQLLMDQGMLTPEIAKASHAKNIVLQACGKARDLVVAQRRLELRDGDRLLLCSDGLTVHVADFEIATVLKSVTAPERACATLVRIANERGGRDNVSVLIADVAGSLPRPGPHERIADAISSIREFSLAEAGW